MTSEKIEASMDDPASNSAQAGIRVIRRHTRLVPERKSGTVRLLTPDQYTTERLTEMSDAELDLLIAEIGKLDADDAGAYSDVLQRATRLISDRREW